MNMIPSLIQITNPFALIISALPSRFNKGSFITINVLYMSIYVLLRK